MKAYLPNAVPGCGCCAMKYSYAVDCAHKPTMKQIRRSGKKVVRQVAKREILRQMEEV